MSVIRNSPRAFFLALLPLAILHAMLMANGVAPTAANGALPIPDWALIVFAGRLCLDSALLFLGHTRLRALGLHRRGVYGVMGGFAAAISHMIANRPGTTVENPHPGPSVEQSTRDFLPWPEGPADPPGTTCGPRGHLARGS